MKTLLDDLQTHIAADGWLVAVGARPDDAEPTLPYVMIAQTSASISGTIDAGSLDADRDPLIHVKAVGTSFEQTATLHDRLDVLLRTFTAAYVHTVTVELEQGPARDTSVHPDPHSWWCDLYLRVLTTRP